MTQVEAHAFSCKSCQKQYRWKPELAGKTVKCKCGQPLTVPRNVGAAAKVPPPPPPKRKTDDEVDFDNLSALAEGAEAPASENGGYRCPACQANLAPGAAVCMSCGTDLRTGKRVTTIASVTPAAATAAPAAFAWGNKPQPAPGARGFTADNLIYEGSKFRSLYLPILLIVVGLIFYVGQLMMASAEDKLATGAWVTFMAVNFAADAILIFVALIVAVKFLDMGFGALGPAVLKIFAIAIGPGAMGEIAFTALQKPMGELGALIVGGVIAIALYYTLIKVLFQLDLNDTIRLTGLIYFLRKWVKFFIIMGLLAMFMGGAASLSDDGSSLQSDDDDSSDVMSEDGGHSNSHDEDDDADEEEEAAPQPAVPQQSAPTPANAGQSVPAQPAAPAQDNSGL